jgi:hypothetical protein
MDFDIDLILENIKIKLSITDNEEDALLEVLCNDAYAYMNIFFDGNVPVELQFILESVAIKRYRRIGAEGIAIEKIDVLTTTYESGDDFAEYINIMNQYKRRLGRENGPRGFRFL